MWPGVKGIKPIEDLLLTLGSNSRSAVGSNPQCAKAWTDPPPSTTPVI